MIQIQMAEGQPYISLVLDGHDVVLMAPMGVSFMLEWPKSHVLAYAEYRGWSVQEVADEC